MPGFVDSFGRAHDDLRLSVTDRCNLRCSYCMPEEPIWFPRSELLSFEEILRIVGLAAANGVRKVRLTGGEPLVRRELPQLIAHLSEIPGIDDLSLTTNGLLLESMAQDLAAAGLRRVNVSLDTLDRERFQAMTRRDALDRALRGIAVSIATGLRPMKVNTVLLRDSNEDEIEILVQHARRHGWELRFIEYMPLENNGSWDPSRVVQGDEVRRRIDSRWPLESDPSGDPHAPATRFLFRDGGGAVGFINSVSEPFCASCSRLRLTSDGQFRVCLYDPAGVDLKTVMRGGADDAELLDCMQRAVRGKGAGGALEVLERRQALPLDRTMHQIGG